MNALSGLFGTNDADALVDSKWVLISFICGGGISSDGRDFEFHLGDMGPG